MGAEIVPGDRILNIASTSGAPSGRGLSQPLNPRDITRIPCSIIPYVLRSVTIVRLAVSAALALILALAANPGIAGPTPIPLPRHPLGHIGDTPDGAVIANAANRKPAATAQRGGAKGKGSTPAKGKQKAGAKTAAKGGKGSQKARNTAAKATAAKNTARSKGSAKHATAKSSAAKSTATRTSSGRKPATSSATNGSRTNRATSNTIRPKPRQQAGDGDEQDSATASRGNGPRITPRLTIEQQVFADSTHIVELADGITHRWIATRGHQIANVVTIALSSGARLRTLKARDRYDGLQTAADIGRLAADRAKDTVLAATNASFWRAGSNSPIGPTVHNGEVIEMPGYKQWSSLMLFADGTAAIDRVTMNGEVFWKGRQFQVAAVNRRASALGIVVFNRLYGDSVPIGARKSDSAIIAEAVANKVISESGDDTEGNAIDTGFVVRSYRDARLLEDKEHPMLKVACVLAKPKRKRDPMPGPVVGDTMRLVVTEVDTGAVAIPEGGYVLSLGIQAEWFSVVTPGDTIGLLYTISPAPAKRVVDMLTGTPRIVRNGIADPEYETEGSRAKRFVDGKLARTAVGISKDGDTLMMVTINSGCTCNDSHGMSLEQLAEFMRSQGAYQAINFDGGGSASMAVNGEMISLQGSRPSSRRVSNALLAVRPFKARKVARMPIITE